ncbi:MAG: VCBS repeat-containing protein [Deltaproteobacteria bacterium]|nr:VCBS repeat-containing protein [Deltaproteobacteria bacterium]
MRTFPNFIASGRLGIGAMVLSATLFCGPIACGDDASTDTDTTTGDTTTGDTTTGDTTTGDTTTGDTTIGDTSPETDTTPDTDATPDTDPDTTPDTTLDSDTTLEVSDTTAPPAQPGFASILVPVTASQSSPSGALNVFQSSGTAFLTGSNWATTQYTAGSRGALIGDFDGDGLADVARMSPSGRGGPGALAVRLSTGTNFGAESTWRNVSYNVDTVVVRVADFDGDGRDDVAFLYASGPGSPPSANVFLSTGTGFADSVNWFAEGGSIGSAATLVGDFDGDGRADLAKLSAGGRGGPGVVSIQLSTGTAFAASTVWTPANGFEPGSVGTLVGDFDGDGRDDLMRLSPASRGGPASASVALSTGTAFANPSNWTAATNDFSPGSGGTLVGDFNGDGYDDLATIANNGPGGPGSIGIRLSTGTGFSGVSNWLPSNGSIFVGDVPAVVGVFAARPD